jgi:hypothetical protein
MGSPAFRRVAPVIGVIGIALLAHSPSASAQTLYKYSGVDEGFSPYRGALIALTISDGVVSGQLRPLLGDNSAAVDVRGTNPKDGRLDLTIDFRSGPRKFSFVKKVTGQKIVWQDPQDGSRLFYRYLDSPLSEAAMTLSEHECGAHYRAMVAELLPQATNDRLNAFLATNPQASALAVTYADYDEKQQLWTKKKTVSLRELLKLQLTASGPDKVGGQFETAVGTEAYLAKWLRQSGLFRFVDLDPVGCDGADRSYFVVDRGLMFDADGLSQPKFEQYIETRLRDFASRDDNGKAWQYRVGQPRVTRVNVPPYPLAYRVRLYAASEVTRHVPGWWDAFSLTFGPGELIDTKKADYAIVVTVERLKASKRSAGNSSPPDDAYFSKELTSSDEAEVTAAIARYFSRRDGGWCNVELAGDEAEKHHVVCDVQAGR